MWPKLSNIFKAKPRQEVSMQDMAVGLLTFARRSEESDLKLLGQGDLEPASIDTLRWELFCLRCFAIDLGIWSVMQAHQNREALRSAITSCIEMMFGQSPKSAPLLHQMAARQSGYATAMKIESPNGPAYQIGKEFAKVIGKPDDLSFIMAGSLEFAGTIKQVPSILKNCGVC